MPSKENRWTYGDTGVHMNIKKLPHVLQTIIPFGPLPKRESLQDYYYITGRGVYCSFPPAWLTEEIKGQIKNKEEKT